MHRLPLYATPPRAPVESTAPMRRNPACNRCELHRDAGVVCAGADGSQFRGPGAILVVTGAPMKRDALGLPGLPPRPPAGPPGAPTGPDAPEATPNILPPLFAPSVAPVRRAVAEALSRAGVTTPNVVYDWSIRCPLPRGGGATKTLIKPARMCRPYLAESIRAIRPSRILALGGAAVLALFGADAPTPMNARRGWGWLASPPGGGAPHRGTPVFILDDALAALSIPSMRGEYLDDVAWAVTHDPPAPPWSGSALECRTADDTDAALDLLSRCAWVSIDLETNGGELWHPSLRLTAFAMTPGPFRASAVPPADHPAFAGLTPEVVEAARAWTVDVPHTPEGVRTADPSHHPAPRGAATIGYVWSGARTPYQPSEQRAADFPRVLAFLRDPRVGKVGANVKFDLNVLRTLYGDEGIVRNVVLDTRLVGRVIDSEAAADLDTMGWLVGCGGHKGEAQQALLVAQRALKSSAKAAAKVLPGQMGLFGGPVPSVTAPATPATDTAPGAVVVPPEVAADPDAFAAWFREAAVDPEEREAADGEGDAAAPQGDADATPTPDTVDAPPAPVTGLQPQDDAEGYAIPAGASVKSSAYALLTGTTHKVYNARDTVTTARLAESLAHTLYARRPNLGFIWSDVERAATETFSAIESRGYPIDRRGIIDVSRRVGEMQEKHRAEITRLAPGLNPDSPQQIARFLYGDLGLPVEHTTDKGAPATDRKALKGMAGKHPVVTHLSSLSELSHLRSIYLDGNPDPGQPVGGMLKRIRADCRVHTRYDLAGARTGRLSSGDPNLQNIPRAETEMGRLIKDLFVAPAGYKWVQMDFCLARGTLVDTPRGHVPIEALRPGDLVFSYNHTTKRPDCSRVSRWVSTGVRATMLVTLDNGERVRCTPEHRWLRVDGSEVYARDLNPGTAILGAGHTPAARVAVVERDGLLADTFDIEVERDHNFALAAGVYVHNSQLELRVAATLSRDNVMADLFASGEDFHMKTGELVARVAFGITPDKWAAMPPKERKPYRSFAKTVNFALAYGQGVKTTALALGVTVETAQSIFDAVLGSFKSFAAWTAAGLEETNRTGLIPTFWQGRRARERRVHRTEYRGTVSTNSRVQGTGSTFCLASCVAVEEWLTSDLIPAHLVGTVHDSLHILAREDVVAEVVHGTAAIMEGWAPGGLVRFIVDAEVGDRLGSLAGYDIRRHADMSVVW